MIRVHNVTKEFGGVVAVENFSLKVKRGVLLGLIGPNGAGKTTLVNLISGFYRPDAGEIYFKNERISGLRPYEIARKGIGRTFQITRVFEEITCLENMLVPFTWRPEKLWSIKDRAIELLKFFGLFNLVDELAGNLSGGQQKLLELARVSMLDPEFFILDEPFYGIHPTLKNKIITNIRTMNDTYDKTFLIISHDMTSIMGTCKEIAVMNAGKLISLGSPEAIRNDERVIEAYLGV